MWDFYLFELKLSQILFKDEKRSLNKVDKVKPTFCIFLSFSKRHTYTYNEVNYSRKKLSRLNQELSRLNHSLGGRRG